MTCLCRGYRMKAQTLTLIFGIALLFCAATVSASYHSAYYYDYPQYGNNYGRAVGVRDRYNEGPALYYGSNYNPSARRAEPVIVKYYGSRYPPAMRPVYVKSAYGANYGYTTALSGQYVKSAYGSRYGQSYSDLNGPYVESGYIIHTDYYRGNGRYDDVVPRYYRVY